jgi:hypothetical protein
MRFRVILTRIHTLSIAHSPFSPSIRSTVWFNSLCSLGDILTVFSPQRSSGAPVYLPDYNQFTQAVTRSSAYKASKIAFLLKDATESYVKEIVAYA